MAVMAKTPPRKGSTPSGRSPRPGKPTAAGASTPATSAPGGKPSGRRGGEGAADALAQDAGTARSSPPQALPWTPERIRKLRERLGLTQAQAAAKVNGTWRTWQSWELGDRQPSPQAALLLDLLDSGKI